MKKILFIILVLMLLGVTLSAQYQNPVQNPMNFKYYNGFDFYRVYHGPVNYWTDNWNNYYVQLNGRIYVMTYSVWSQYTHINWVQLYVQPFWSWNAFKYHKRCRNKRRSYRKSQNRRFKVRNKKLNSGVMRKIKRKSHTRYKYKRKTHSQRGIKRSAGKRSPNRRSNRIKKN